MARQPASISTAKLMWVLESNFPAERTASAGIRVTEGGEGKVEAEFVAARRDVEIQLRASHGLAL